MFFYLNPLKRKLLVVGLGMLLCFTCAACKTVDTSGEVSATVSTIDGGGSK
ncbi:hypothetical protein [Maridesulfovibrio salexigens]|uniref:Uncharacterized protein n=1 Tax=Maridesulfovibrio salexigens (strain ATCC 14822 / DSM 2638 / NCIMB 8403 / VKM B-1763) TaxID=526222 RepID=C6BX80_MARSD|nr:hypothetical protein [Maridesulfovibrio salexigens]ACS80386.1 hypothetical protein Desal_2330 [Maridesulfovibrio salexigens DSM 2638]